MESWFSDVSLEMERHFWKDRMSTALIPETKYLILHRPLLGECWILPQQSALCVVQNQRQSW